MINQHGFVVNQKRDLTIRPKRFSDQQERNYNSIMADYIQFDKGNHTLQIKYDNLKRAIKMKETEIKDASKIVKMSQLKKHQNEIKEQKEIYQKIKIECNPGAGGLKGRVT